MKIAIIHPRILLRGGLETRLFNYISWFHERGHEVHVFCFKKDPKVLLPSGVIVHVLPARWPPKPFRAWLFNRLLARHLSSGWDFRLSLGRTSHQDALLIPGNHLGFLRATGKKRKGLKDNLEIMMDRKGYESPGVLLAASEMMKREAIELYQVPPKKIAVLFPPINTKKFFFQLKSQKDSLRRELGLEPAKFYAVFLSSNHRLKGLPYILPAIKNLQSNGVELIVAGHDSFEPASPGVHYWGFLKETQKLLAAADVLIHPSNYEPFGQVVAEALLCGTPVIVSKLTGASEVVEHQWGTILPELSAESVERALRDLFLHPKTVPPDLVSKYHLSLDDHMARMLALSGKNPADY